MKHLQYRPQEVLDLNPRGVILMLQGDYMMVFIPAESENHHVTTHIPHEIMTVVTHWLQVLTVGKEAWKIALTDEVKIFDMNLSSVGVMTVGIQLKGTDIAMREAWITGLTLTGDPVICGCELMKRGLIVMMIGILVTPV
jgi:hypothetical protein